ncbi:MAG: DNA-binding response regulator [Bacteroidota bacterium]
MQYYRALIVEDEIIIADILKRYLQKNGHQVIGMAISYEEATKMYLEEQPDITFLDIRLNGTKTGIDVARFIQGQNHSSPFIFLSSQLDIQSINAAKCTFPSGYLTKPVQKASLYTTMEMAMYAHQVKQQQSSTVKFNDGTSCHAVPIKDILYLEVDHVYVSIVLENGRRILQRASLKEILYRLPAEQFIQTHRAFAINVKQINRWDHQQVYIQNEAIPVSRARRRKVELLLKSLI